MLRAWRGWKAQRITFCSTGDIPSKTQFLVLPTNNFQSGTSHRDFKMELPPQVRRAAFKTELPSRDVQAAFAPATD
jgi:hypothetical protein